MKKVTCTFLVNDDTNQDSFKSWVKTCPYSKEGNQTVTFENVAGEVPLTAEEQVQLDADADKAEQDAAAKPDADASNAAPATSSGQTDGEKPVTDDNGNPHPMEGSGIAQVEGKAETSNTDKPAYTD